MIFTNFGNPTIQVMERTIEEYIYMVKGVAVQIKAGTSNKELALLEFCYKYATGQL